MILYLFPTYCMPRRLPDVFCYSNPSAGRLHCTWLHSPVTFATLYLLQHLKVHFPAAKGSSTIHACFQYYLWWHLLVSQGMFALQEINQIERKMCSWSGDLIKLLRRTLLVQVQCIKRPARHSYFQLHYDNICCNALNGMCSDWQWQVSDTW
jgi:hypothetical protein